MNKTSRFFLTLSRLSLGFVFLWAFFDKTFGLGFATPSSSAWISGASPTAGFLTNAVQGPFASFFQNLAGLGFVDWAFMLGLLFVGLSFIMKVQMRLGAVIGAVMLVLMYLALLWPENNPFMDDHLVYAFVMMYIGFRNNK